MSRIVGHVEEDLSGRAAAGLKKRLDRLERLADSQSSEDSTRCHDHLRPRRTGERPESWSNQESDPEDALAMG
jgi:hypothetical protein